MSVIEAGPEIPGTYITDCQLAEEMAYASKPYLDSALLIDQTFTEGLNSKPKRLLPLLALASCARTALLDLADNAETDAGTEYLAKNGEALIVELNEYSSDKNRIEQELLDIAEQASRLRRPNAPGYSNPNNCWPILSPAGREHAYQEIEKLAKLYGVPHSDIDLILSRRPVGLNVDFVVKAVMIGDQAPSRISDIGSIKLNGDFAQRRDTLRKMIGDGMSPEDIALIHGLNPNIKEIVWTPISGSGNVISPSSARSYNRYTGKTQEDFALSDRYILGSRRTSVAIRPSANIATLPKGWQLMPELFPGHAAILKAGELRKVRELANKKPEVSPWEALTPEQRAYADEARFAIARQLGDVELAFGFEPIELENDGSEGDVPKYMIAYTGSEAIYLGDRNFTVLDVNGYHTDTEALWDSVMGVEGDKKWIVEIAGKQVDLRKDQNRRTLESICRANPRIGYETVLMTGETDKATDEQVPVMFVSRQEGNRSFQNPERIRAGFYPRSESDNKTNFRSTTIRPAVLIP